MIAFPAFLSLYDKIYHMNKLSKFVASILICEGVGLISTPFTIAAIPTWYVTLQKPFFSPPNWVFAPVWTFLYFLMGISVYLIWEQGLKKKKVKEALKFFLLQLVLNFMWSLFFFGLHAPFLAFIEIVILWLAIFVTIKKFYPLSRLAAYLLVPYLLWVSFAAHLNFAIVLLNL